MVDNKKLPKSALLRKTKYGSADSLLEGMKTQYANSTHHINCPKCDEVIAVTVGSSTCPHCGENIDLFIDFDF